MRSGERRLVTESPEMHRSAPMQAYIYKEVNRPCKQWIHEVLLSKRETERVKLRTQDFVLLPDVDSVGKRSKIERSDGVERIDGIERFERFERFERCERNLMYESRQVLDAYPKEGKDTSNTDRRQWRTKRISAPVYFHWLAVATDTSLRTLRDLRGCHIPMLQSLYTKTCQRIHEETAVDTGQIMAYIHYPPSVYQLHVHFKHLAGPGMSHDTMRVHTLPTIINNLKIDPEYYSKSRMQLPVYVHTELYLALGLDPTEIQKEESKDPETPTRQLTQLTELTKSIQIIQQSDPPFTKA